MYVRMHYDEVLPDDGCGWERKRFTYDRATHYSYKFMVSGEFYSVVARHINSEHELNQLGYTLPQACSFPAPLMAEVYFDRFHDIESFGNFLHYSSKGLGNGTVLLNVASLMLEHYNTFNLGGFVFQAALPSQTGAKRQADLVEIYDCLLGLSTTPRVNVKTGRVKKSITPLLPPNMRAFKSTSTGRDYVIIC